MNKLFLLGIFLVTCCHVRSSEENGGKVNLPLLQDNTSYGAFTVVEPQEHIFGNRVTHIEPSGCHVVAIGDTAGQVTMVNLITGTHYGVEGWMEEDDCKQDLDRTSAQDLLLACSKDYLAAAKKRNSLLFCNVSGIRARLLHSSKQGDAISALEFNRDSSLFCIARNSERNYASRVELFNLTESTTLNRPVHRLEDSARVKSLALSDVNSKSCTLACLLGKEVGADTSKVYQFTVDSGGGDLSNLVEIPLAEDESFCSIKICPSGNYIAVQGKRCIYLYNKDGRPVVNTGRDPLCYGGGITFCTLPQDGEIMYATKDALYQDNYLADPQEKKGSQVSLKLYGIHNIIAMNVILNKGIREKFIVAQGDSRVHVIDPETNESIRRRAESVEEIRRELLTTRRKCKWACCFCVIGTLASLGVIFQNEVGEFLTTDFG